MQLYSQVNTNRTRIIVSSGRIWTFSRMMVIVLALFMTFMSAVISVTSFAASGNLVSNPEFEGAEGKVPTDWLVFGSSKIGEHLFVIEEDDLTGERAFMIDDRSVTGGYGIRSNPVAVEPGVTYKASAMFRATDGGAGSLYLDFWDANDKRISHRAVSSNRTDWVSISTSLDAPEGAVSVSAILYTQTSHVGRAYFKDVVLEKVTADRWTENDVNQHVGEGQLDYAPGDGSVVTTNPPSFVWIPIAGATNYSLQYSTDENFAPEKTYTIDGIDMSIFTPSEIFDAEATWYWRVSGVDSKGIVSVPTKTRAFRIAPNAVESLLPPLDEVRRRLSPGHPRLFVTPETIDEWRHKSEAELLYRTLWSPIRSRALGLKFEPLPDEPPHTRPGGVWDINLWREYTTTVRATDNMEVLAFAYMMTGDPEYGEAARRWMLHIAGWDPKGATSAAVNDESSMPILLKLSRAYTWAYDALSPEDRQIIQDVMRERGTEAYNILVRRPFESKPYGSHAGRSLGFLGEAAIAFLGDFPEAEQWFDYVVRIFFAIYPAWGGDPGGWAEGHAYWTSYMNRVIWFIDALQAGTGLNLYEKAFFQNTGMFKLYTHPPYSKMGPFGDHADRGPTSSDGNVMAQFAQVYDNEYYKWYAERMGSVVETGVMGYIKASLRPVSQLRGKAPLDLPSSAYFPDVGWVAMHKRLGQSEDSIQFMFKSSPYGSFSHSLADQNTFTLEAYGTPLAISSGYRPWYGSDHHMQWTKTTYAQNGVLVDGKSQMVQSLNAKGEIISFLHGKSFDYTAGEAAAAYGGLMDRYIRHAVYVRPDLFVLFDDLKTPKPSSFSWLLHAYHKMDVDESGGYIGIDAKSATLDVNLWSSEGLTYVQTDEFAVPLDEPMNKPDQWHLTATTDTPASDAYFLAVLAPGKGQERRSVEAEVIDGRSGSGVRIKDGDIETTVLFRTADGLLAGDGLAVSGAVGAWTRSEYAGVEDQPVEPSVESGLLLIGGTEWENDNGIRVESSVDVDAELTFKRSTGSEDGNAETYVEVTGTVISPSGPGAQPFDLVINVPGMSDINEVESSFTIDDVIFQDSGIHLRLAPGEHDLMIVLN